METTIGAERKNWTSSLQKQINWILHAFSYLYRNFEVSAIFYVWYYGDV